MYMNQVAYSSFKLKHFFLANKIVEKKNCKQYFFYFLIKSVNIKFNLILIFINF